MTSYADVVQRGRSGVGCLIDGVERTVTGLQLTINGTTAEMLARTATPLEKRELWPQIVRTYPGYGLYQLRTQREIPVVILTPALASDS